VARSVLNSSIFTTHAPQIYFIRALPYVYSRLFFRKLIERRSLNPRPNVCWHKIINVKVAAASSGMMPIPNFIKILHLVPHGQVETTNPFSLVTKEYKIVVSRCTTCHDVQTEFLRLQTDREGLTQPRSSFPNSI
jgi:hypothetical protein